MTARLHTVPEYAAMRDQERLISACCGHMGCTRDEFPRMLAGLLAATALLRQAVGGQAIDDADILSLPKRYRKPFKLLKRR